ncbi:MAG: hypothetical protein V4650_00150 [Pseudomonadota bacterium]
MYLSQNEALVLTLLIELPVVFAVWEINKKRFFRAGMAGLLATGLTHPLAWSLASRLGAQDYLHGFYLIEIAVVAVEAIVIGYVMPCSWRVAIGTSVLANGLSASVGCFLWST